jgi:hypothetical protein
MNRASRADSAARSLWPMLTAGEEKPRRGLPIQWLKELCETTFRSFAALAHSERSPTKVLAGARAILAVCRAAAFARHTGGTRLKVIFGGCLHPTKNRSAKERRRVALRQCKFHHLSPLENRRQGFPARQPAPQKIPNEKQPIHLHTDFQI